MKARARIDLADQAHGGLVAPMPTPCQSLILRVEPGGSDEQPVDYGVRIATQDGAPLSPGMTDEDVESEFWTDLADVFVVPNTRFTLRYPTRVLVPGTYWASRRSSARPCRCRGGAGRSG